MKTGRYVPVSYVLGSTQNIDTFKQLQPYVDNWGAYSSEDGFPPKKTGVKAAQ